MGLLFRLRPAAPAYDAERERAAEARARELMRSVVSDEEFAMYEELGFVSVPGGGAGYAYLLYPHRPIVAYETATGRLLTEYCVRFHDHGDPAAGERLPDADDVLARWMSLRGGERELVASANLDAPGRQHDPVRIRRDLDALRAWRAASGRG
ncbi:MAG: hypothetical protein ACR2G3_05330 [Solirubrobacterales bacterium]